MGGAPCLASSARIRSGALTEVTLLGHGPGGVGPSSGSLDIGLGIYPTALERKARFSRIAVVGSLGGQRALIGMRVGGARNSFNAIRLLAAVAVLVSHSFAFAGKPQPSIAGHTLGTVAVLVFFGISGFLITQSWLREPHLVRFATKRALRIYPALVVVVALMAFAMGPAVTTLPIGGYFHSAQTWRFAFLNAISFHYELALPGVFAHLPVAGDVNGSIWTLPGELLAYVAVACLGVIGAFRDRRLAMLGLVVVAIAYQRIPGSLVVIDYEWIRAFAAGGILFLLQDRVPWSPWLAAGLLAGMFAVHALAVIALPYAAIVTAYRLPGLLRPITRYGDFSYGTYLYGCPIQQLVVLWLGRSISPGVVFAISLPVTLVFAIVSWRLVERPALALKGRRAPAPAETPLLAVNP